MGKTKHNKNSLISTIKTELIQQTCLFLVSNLFFSFVLIISKEEYYFMGYVLFTVSLIFSIMNLTLGMKDENVLKARYVWTVILMNILMFTMYISAAETFKPNKTIVKIVIALIPVLMEIVLIYKRIVVKNTDYIQRVKKDKHGRYVKQDAILAVIITIVVVLFAKLYDNSPIYVGKTSIMVSGILGTPFASAFTVILHHGFARYIYDIKPNTKF